MIQALGEGWGLVAVGVLGCRNVGGAGGGAKPNSNPFVKILNLTSLNRDPKD